MFFLYWHVFNIFCMFEHPVDLAYVSHSKMYNTEKNVHCYNVIVHIFRVSSYHFFVVDISDLHRQLLKSSIKGRVTRVLT